ncbi:hypothetical protein [Thiovibrio frasassiensis]|uniref:Restriction endonuclease n=1 Tax=Thiovibrio frasassiensis TaxID=2984131 RepID=A0A9X4MDL5_9BACT|nr:hypothetical protein [Thiovibrio frasassiensis]MDG4475396.1 hypothetical protein [Thiovibrio frasassiensis]
MEPSRLTNLCNLLPKLTAGQFEWIENIIKCLSAPFEYERNAASDIVTEEFLAAFGDNLRIHHALSKQAFGKDRFEYALEEILSIGGVPAKLAKRGNPGHDITIRDVPVSLKTQSDMTIKNDEIHISKFHELGKGKWGSEVKDLEGLRDRFFSHMQSYERIFTLRTLSQYPSPWIYELVEIPKSLLLKAKDGTLEMMMGSRQNPKPGYCHVKDTNGKLLFQLYFDGGTERKLQIKHLLKSECIVHGQWKFASA